VGTIQITPSNATMYGYESLNSEISCLFDEEGEEET